METTTSDYWVGVLIGEGAYSRVVHCKYKASNQDVALKILDKVTLQKHPSVMAGLWTERSLLQRFQSEYVVNLWASFHDSQSVYLVLDCLFGGDLSQVIYSAHHHDGKASIGSTSIHADWIQSIPHYALQILAGLEYVHSQHVVHCDLKPANILCSRNGRIKLADFACAVDLATITKAPPLDNPNSSRSILRGTADYASPELQRCIPTNEITTAVDMWSVGCIFYECFNGTSPFHAPNHLLATHRVMEYVNNNISLEELFSGSDDDAIKNQLLNEKSTSEWKSLIGGLLAPSPKLRTTLKEAQRQSCFDSVRVDLSKDGPKFLPDDPEWVGQAKDTKMKDGKAGWAVFEL